MEQTPTMLSAGQINLMACKWILADAERRAAEAKPEPIPDDMLDNLFFGPIRGADFLLAVNCYQIHNRG